MLLDDWRTLFYSCDGERGNGVYHRLGTHWLFVIPAGRFYRPRICKFDLGTAMSRWREFCLPELEMCRTRVFFLETAGRDP